MPQSNLAALMTLYAVTPQALHQAVGADITLISRWRTGRRRLVAGRRWVGDIAAYFVGQDAREGGGRLGALLLIAYPDTPVSTPGERQAALEKWLSLRGQCEDGYARRRDRQLALLRHPGEEAAAVHRLVEAQAPFVVLGEGDTRTAILDMLDRALELPRPTDIRFACPRGLDLLTAEVSFGNLIMDKLMQLFTRGFRLHVVLWSGYSLDPQAALSGRWVAAHLMGYVRSYYSDTIQLEHAAHMTAVFGDRIALRVLGDVRRGVRSEFHYSAEQVHALRQELDRCFGGTAMRFHYDFLKHPGDYLADVPPVAGDCYLLTRMPHLGVRGKSLLGRLNLSAQEAERLQTQFGPLLTAPADVGPQAHFYHILCIEEIERALDKPRHRVMPPGDIFGRRVYMTTQALVNQLAAMAAQLRVQPGYHLCLLPESAFAQMPMELAILGNQAAVGWIAGETSAACKDATHMALLQAFAAGLWARIPAAAKNRGAAARRLNAWLRRARNYGYRVEE